MVVYLKEYYQTPHSLYILQDNGTEFKNSHLISTFESLGIKRIYSSSFYQKGNGRIENMQNFLKRTIVKFMHNSSFEWDDALPLSIYCFNVAPWVNKLESILPCTLKRFTRRKVNPSSE